MYLRLMFCILAGFLTVSSGFPGGIDSPQGPKSSGLRLGTFDVDATPPVGSRLAYNTMINSWDLGLRAKGIVLIGAGQPVVLCSVDWIGIANEGQDVFKRALADAAGTIPERVAVHTIHQHDAPACDFAVERLLKEQGLDPLAFEGSFARELVRRLEIAVRQALVSSQPVTDIGLGEAKVNMVASSRRIIGADGRLEGRMSSCKDSALIAAPEGVIDPMVSLVSFWNNDQPIAVLSYYAVHPQSYYGTGVANPDYPGVARFFRQLAVPKALHIHFNGAGGDVSAGKYNDGSRERRGILAERLADGMKLAWEATRREPITADAVRWTVEPVALPPAKKIEQLQTRMMESLKAPDRKEGSGAENLITNDMSKIPFLQRCKAGKKIDVGCLTLGRARILFMPGELAVEYQIAAKAERPDLFVAMAAYGDYAPGYICTAIQYTQGGYEVGASGVEPEVEGVLMTAIHTLLKGKP